MMTLDYLRYAWSCHLGDTEMQIKRDTQSHAIKQSGKFNRSEPD